MCLYKKGKKGVNPFAKKDKDDKKKSKLDEKWSQEAKVNPKEKGKHTNKSVEQLRKELASAKKAGNTGLIKELDFAIRAKTGWGKVNK